MRRDEDTGKKWGPLRSVLVLLVPLLGSFHPYWSKLVCTDPIPGVSGAFAGVCFPYWSKLVFTGPTLGTGVLGVASLPPRYPQSLAGRLVLPRYPQSLAKHFCLVTHSP